MTLRDIPKGTIFAYLRKDGSYSEGIYIKKRYNKYLHEWECPRFGYADRRIFLSGKSEVEVAR